MMTSVSPKTSKREGVKQGEHRRFCFGHQNRRFIKNHNKTPQRGEFIHSGYVYVIAPEDHPHKTNKRYIKRCRLVMENILKRHLLHREQVHHIDMDRSNDDPSNLKIMSLPEHNREHRKIRRMLDARLHQNT